MAARAKSLPGQNQKKIIENHSYWVSLLGVGPGLGMFAGFDGLRSPRTACDISLIYNALYKHSGHEPDEWDAGLSCSSSFTSKQRWSVCRIFSVDGTSLLSARSAYVN